MIDKKVKETIKKIKELRIQGARNVAISAIDTLSKYAERYKGDNFLKDFLENAEALSKSRPTEPMLRNGIKYILTAIKKNEDQDRDALRKLVEETGAEFLEYCDAAQKKIIEVGANRIPANSAIMVHCHSSTVVNILKKAKKKKIRVICLETRPVFQGRKTAKELSEAGIPTTLIVDSAMRSFIKKVDLVLIGADAVCANGAVINKIGTSLLALCAHEQRKPLYVAAETYKFDPETTSGTLEEIEERKVKEVADPKKLPKVKIRNPAFDATPPEYIDLLITEEGIMSPHNVYDILTWRK